MKKFLFVVVLIALLVSSCAQADVASNNLSIAADNFEINRRIHFYNGITGEDFLVIEGLCSLGNSDKTGSLSVTCKVGANTYKKFFLGLSDNVTYFSEDLEPAPINVWNYRVILRPSAVIPGLELQTP
jgi:hypothetical protein